MSDTFYNASGFTAFTYTPTIGDGTNNFTMTAQVGQYVKIGNVWIGNVRITWTSKGSASGTIKISLPTAVSASQDRCVVTVGYSQGVAANNISSAANPSEAFFVLSTNNGSGTMGALGAANYSTSGDLICSFIMRF